ncbi:MAG TPA: hypothetical protein PKG48_00635 [Bacteroidales bacterium]|nr:hypothetical protein [Bacteroidales bacterium]HPS63471.1 hypothetical protein [Bacteroidales bacterium]
MRPLIIGWLIIILAGGILLNACRKDNQDPASPTGVRLSHAENYIDGAMRYTMTCTYTGSLLSRVAYSLPPAGEFALLTPAYTGDRILSVRDQGFGGNGSIVYDLLFEVNGYSGEHPSEIIIRSIDTAGVQSNEVKDVYTYEGIWLKAFEEFDFTGSMWNSRQRITYAYDGGGNILTITDTSGYNGKRISTYSYAGGRMTECLVSDYVPGNLYPDRKTLYEYSGDHLAKATSYLWNGSDWVYDGDTRYDYDADGNLAGTQTTELGPFVMESMVYAYEKGAGNYRQLLKAIRTLMLPGDPTPYPR